MNNFKMNLIIIMALLLVITGCSNNSKNDVLNDDKLISDPNKVFIGFLLDTLQEERWYKDKELFEGEVDKLGGIVKTLAANGLDDVQFKQAELLIEEGVDVLVVVPHDAEVSAAIVDLAHEAGVKVISYDRLIKNAQVDYYVSFDNEKVGELQAAEIVKRTSAGQFAYVGGSESDNNAILFRQGAMKVLQPLIDKGDIRLVFDHYTESWDPANAEKNMIQALKENSNEIDAVIAANDGTAGGVIKALSTVGLDGKVPVSGQDAELAGVQRVVEGTQTMTIYKSINQLAAQAAEMAVKVAQGESVATDRTINNGKLEVPSILLNPITVTKDNVQETVIRDGFLKEQDIYKK